MIIHHQSFSHLPLSFFPPLCPVKGALYSVRSIVRPSNNGTATEDAWQVASVEAVLTGRGREQPCPEKARFKVVGIPLYLDRVGKPTGNRVKLPLELENHIDIIFHVLK